MCGSKMIKFLCILLSRRWESTLFSHKCGLGWFLGPCLLTWTDSISISCHGIFRYLKILCKV